MESIKIKFENNMLSDIDKAINKFHYPSRAEFVREAVLQKLALLDYDEKVARFLAFRGKSPVKTPLEEDSKIREQVSKEFLDKLNKKFK